jgi:transcriptional regulator with XRE-family HTH domain
MTETSPSRSALVRELGAEVKQAREGAGLGQRELAKAAEISSHSRISEQESGKRLLPPDELGRIFTALGLPDSERERLLGLARAAEGPGQLNTGQPGIDATLAQLIDHERAATRIIDASPLLIPGLLQTSAYARAIMGDEPDSELRVTLRSGRRDILIRPRDPVQLFALIDSEALVRPIAPPLVMLDQWRHILQLAELDNVTVQVVSSMVPGYHPMLAGPFEVIFFEKAAPIVLLDHYASSAFLWKEDALKFVEAAEEIRTKVAMTPEESTRVIADIVRGLETT